MLCQLSYAPMPALSLLEAVAKIKPIAILPRSRRRKEPFMISEFKNETLTDFSKPENRAAMEAAVRKVGSQLGKT